MARWWFSQILKMLVYAHLQNAALKIPEAADQRSKATVEKTDLIGNDEWFHESVELILEDLLIEA